MLLPGWKRPATGGKMHCRASMVFPRLSAALRTNGAGPHNRRCTMAAARSIGSLTISFGLVAIPVKLYTATQSANAISFNLLHKGCGSRLKQQYVCLKDGAIVERDDMVKG